MKSPILVLFLAGILGTPWGSLAQNQSPAPADNPQPVNPSTSMEASPNQAPEQPAPSSPEPEPQPSQDPGQEAEQEEPAASVPGEKTEPLKYVEEGAPTGVDLAAEQAGGAADEVIPLVQLDGVPLLDAIRTLARQAKINVQFDPALTTQVGPDGQPVPQPNVSLRLEKVTARQVLKAVLENHDLEMIPDADTGIARITRKDPAAPPPLLVKVFPLRYANPTNLVSLVKPTLSDNRSQVIPDSRTSQLMVLAVERDFAAVEKLIEKLDEPTQQILIEAQMFETSRNPSTIKGIDWSGTLENQNVTFGNGVTVNNTQTTTGPGSTTRTLPSGRTVTSSGSTSTTTSQRTSTWDPLNNVTGMGVNTSDGFSPQTAFLNADGIRAVLSFLNKDSDSKVVATPRAVTLDNQTATLEVTRAFPIFQQNPGSVNNPATTSILYTNLGTILRVTPRIADTNVISMRVEPEVSNIDSQDRQIISGQENIANIYAIRRIDTHVMITDGNTLAMGGLISDSTTKGFTKVPILGDIPLFGRLFRHESKERNKSNLLIFITPTIVKDDDFHASKSNFLQNKPEMRIDPDPGPWESGRPHDWTEPVYK